MSLETSDQWSCEVLHTTASKHYRKLNTVAVHASHEGLGHSALVNN